MGSTMSKIRDDEEDYGHLCAKFNEKYYDVYSTHHKWLEAKNENKTSLSYKEFSNELKKKSILSLINKREKEIEELKVELSKL